MKHHSSNKLNRAVIDRFWEIKSKNSDNRWNGEGFLQYELDFLNCLSFSKNSRNILDLGSGHGKLSRKFVKENDKLIAVDYQKNYEKSFSDKPNHNFSLGKVQDFKSDEKFDLILMFGVVTYLSNADELKVYSSISGMLKNDGYAIIKNQCADFETFYFEGYSTKLSLDYCGKYQTVKEQRLKLNTYFRSVSVIVYPTSFKAHADTSHVMFVCRKIDS
jgi:2-polyprenyl-3-methyl-5-hydroxy-6-metoxy-1,4-benzoquinol methylase